eukprot:gene17964-605_t
MASSAQSAKLYGMFDAYPGQTEFIGGDVTVEDGGSNTITMKADLKNVIPTLTTEGWNIKPGGRGEKWGELAGYVSVELYDDDIKLFYDLKGIDPGVGPNGERSDFEDLGDKFYADGMDDPWESVKFKTDLLDKTVAPPSTLRVVTIPMLLASSFAFDPLTPAK